MDKRYLFFDVECANCFEGRGKLCSYGYVLTDEAFNIIEKDDVLLDPKNRWDPYVLRKIIGYQKKVFEGKPLFSEIHEELKEFMTEPSVIPFGFAVANDLKYINDDCKRYRLEPIEPECFDIADFYTLYKKETGDADFKAIEAGNPQGNRVPGLAKIAQEFEIDCSELFEHISCDDAEMTMLVMKEICRRLNIDAPELLRRCADKITSLARIKKEQEAKAERKRLEGEFRNKLKQLEDKYYRRRRSRTVCKKKFCISDCIAGDDALLDIFVAAFKAGYHRAEKVNEADYYICGEGVGKTDKLYQESVDGGKEIKRISMAELLEIINFNAERRTQNAE